MMRLTQQYLNDKPHKPSAFAQQLMLEHRLPDRVGQNENKHLCGFEAVVPVSTNVDD